MRQFLIVTITTASLFNGGIPADTIASATPDLVRMQVAQQPNCNNPQTQSEMNACAGIAYRNADRRLNQLYQQLLPNLSASRRQQLVTAQQAWIRFRDASCTFERSGFEGGSMAPMVQANCLARVTEQRVKDLQNYLQELRNR